MFSNSIHSQESVNRSAMYPYYPNGCNKNSSSFWKIEDEMMFDHKWKTVKPDDYFNGRNVSPSPQFKDFFPTSPIPSSPKNISPNKWGGPNRHHTDKKLLYSAVLSNGIQVENCRGRSTSSSASNSSLGSSALAPSMPASTKRNPSRYKTELCRPFQVSEKSIRKMGNTKSFNH